MIRSFPGRRRRNIAILLSVYALAFASGLAWWIFASPRADEQLVFGSASVPGAPRTHEIAKALGYFREEGLDPQFRFIHGSANVLIQVVGHQIDLGSVGIEPVVVGKQQGKKGLPVRYFYNSAPRGVYEIAVPASSSIHSIAALKGHVIGIAAPSMSFLPQLRGLLRQAGVDPDRDVMFRSTGVGAAALHALATGVVDASSLNDTEHATFEVKGLKLRRLDLGPTVASFSTAGLLAREDRLADPAYRRRFVKFARALAKASLFCATNAEACIRLNWAINPQTKPSGDDPRQTLDNALYVYRSSLRNGRLRPWQHGQYGLYDTTSWQDFVDFMRHEGAIAQPVSVRDLYTNDLIAQINHFDREQVIQQARHYRVPN
jgi:NitT/TauT family transport system substrate-binding protein